MKRTFFARSALPILMIVFFLVPFALRGARVSVQSMKNDVRDWLPSTFSETREMAWFWKHFLGERFVIASWNGCEENDETYRLMLRKLKMEVPPSLQAQYGDGATSLAAENSAAAGDLASTPSLASAAHNDAANNDGSDSPATAEASAESSHAVLHERGMHAVMLERPYRFIGDSLGLFHTGEDYLNWGNRNEKWVQGKAGLWYYITPDGSLYEWDGGKAPVAAIASKLMRTLLGGEIEGKRVASFGPIDGPWYYESPRRMDAQLFRSVTTGPMVLAGLTRDGGVLRDNEHEAMERLSGSLYGPDGKTTCLMLIMSEAAITDLHRTIGRGLLGKPRGRLYDLAESCGIKAEELHIGGPTVDNVAIDEEGSRTLVRLVSLCVVLGVTLAYLCFRTITATIIVFFIGGISAVSSIALVGWCHSTLDAVLMSMPSLVYVLAISGAVHLINYYREAVEEHGVEGAPEAAVLHGWKPALMCNITTAIGLFSLYTSELTPIRKFGMFSGIAVLGTLTLLFTYLPAALQIWPQKPRSKEQKERDENPWYEKYLANFWNLFGGGIIRHHYLVSATCVAVIVIVGYGVTRINTSVNMLKMFDGHAKILQDYEWLERNIGKLVPMEVVVKVQPRLLMASAAERQAAAEPDPDEAVQLTFLDRMDIVNRVQQVIEAEFGEKGQGVAGRSLSAVTFAPVLPDLKGDTGTFMRRGATAARLESHRDEFLKSEYLRLDQQDGSELWRVSLRIGALQDVDYGEFIHEVKSAIEPVMLAHRDRELILRQLNEAREGKSLARAKVYLLGAPLGAVKKTTKVKTTARKRAEEAAEAEAAKEKETADDHGSEAVQIADTRRTDRPPLNQTQIFANTLKDLLTVARLQVSWHDPSIEPLPENWQEKLAGYDCVVVVGDDAQYDLAAIREKAPLVVDARDHHFDPTASVTAAEQHLPVAAVYTGVVPIVYKAQRTLLNSLIESTFWSLITITPLMMFISRSVWCGLVAMLPNVLPIFVIFGAMGWSGIQVDIGSMMTASIALGVAVDDTIHYLTWFRWELDSGKNRHEAILAAYKRCATPTFQAAIISGLGLSIFAFSTFTPTQRFGYLMLSILFMGVVAELIFFPSLLAGPLGRFFKPRAGAPKPPDEIARELRNVQGELAIADVGAGSSRTETEAIAADRSASTGRRDAGHPTTTAESHVLNRQTSQRRK
jgi:predicted RND superfamily exporter protein